MMITRLLPLACSLVLAAANIRAQEAGPPAAAPASAPWTVDPHG